MKNSISLYIILLFLSQVAFSQKAEKALEVFLDDPGFNHSSIGISIINLENKNQFISHNENINLIPASTVKILSTLAALQFLDSNYTYETQFGYTGKIQDDNTLKGDLIINASGDPSLCSEYFDNGNLDQLCKNIYLSLLACKIDCIDGNLILRQPASPRDPIVDTWQWQDIGNYYGAGAYPFNVSDNSYHLTFNTNKKLGSHTQINSVRPNNLSIIFDNEVLVGKANSGDRSYIYGSPSQNTRTIKGTLPKRKGGYTIKGALPNPGQFFLEYLKNFLYERGINIEQTIIENNSKKDPINILYTVNSPQIKELIKITNEESVNLYAEAILNTVLITTEVKSAQAVNQLLFRDLGVKNYGINIKDGSGLSARNRISALALADLLASAVSRPWYDNFKKSLAVGGKEGTLKSMFKNSKSIRVIAKSGSMDKVKAYAGYIEKGGKELYAFTIIINEYNMGSSRLKNKVEKFILDIADI